jgi:hypothetical protein
MSGLLRAFWGAFASQETAEQQGMRLLKANLTPAQRRQLERSNTFDVIGGETGRRYRVHGGQTLNIDELDADGCCIYRLCFLPCGRLPSGDVLLAQKIALELFERNARAVANIVPAFPTDRYQSARSWRHAR